MRLQRKKEEPEIPTASLADIAFLLIILFMITSTFAVSKGIFFNLPKEAPTTLGRAEEAIYIHILEDGNVMVDQKPMKLMDIQEYVRKKVEINRTKPVIIHCEPNALYANMVDVFDELKQLEFDMYPENRDDDPTNDKHINIAIPSRSEIEAWGELLGGISE